MYCPVVALVSPIAAITVPVDGLTAIDMGPEEFNRIAKFICDKANGFTTFNISDHIMESINLPKGLIRYASEENIENKKKFEFTPRLKGYTAVLVILVGVLSGMLLLRNDVEATILRLPGQLYEHKENNIISNVYTYKVINKTIKDIQDVNYKILSHTGKIKLVSNHNFIIPKQSLAEGTLFIELNTSAIKKDKIKLEIGVFSGTRLIETTFTNFLGPRSYR